MSEKVYMDGNGKEAPFCKGKGDVINFSLRVEDVTAKAEGEWINLSICRRREVDKYGNSHYIILNDYKPNADKGNAAQASGGFAESTPDEDNPFK